MILIILYALSVKNSSGFTPILLLGFLPIFVICLPVLLIIMFITLIIIFFKVRDKDVVSNTNLVADIGNTINSIFLLIGFGLLEMILRLGY